MKRSDQICELMSLISKALHGIECEGTDFCVALSILAIGSMVKLGIDKEEMVDIMSDLYDSWDNFKENQDDDKQI
jgi:hypothetical protein